MNLHAASLDFSPGAAAPETDLLPVSSVIQILTLEEPLGVTSPILALGFLPEGSAKANRATLRTRAPGRDGASNLFPVF